MLEMDDMLVSKNRMVDGLDYLYTGELKTDLGSLGIKLHAPVLDRFSPLAYSVADHVHWKLAPHKGMETHNRVSLEHVHILQGMSLYRELSQECIRCNMRRKRFVQAEMGGLSQYQLTVAPPFWACQMDLFGPYRTFVPGYERTTRNRNSLESQVHIMCTVCPTSRLVNLQVIEETDAGGIMCGVTRLVCEVGFPKYFFIDQHSPTMAGMGAAEFDFRDLQLRLHRQHGITFDTCSVGGHDSHGHVERVIKSLQQGLDDCGLKEQRLHAMGLQSLCKLVENSYNSVPIGYSYDRDQDNTAILKMITPNMLKMGRTNQRTLDGPIRLARGSRELLEKVEALYDSWFKVWQDTVVPKLLFQPKWYDSDKDLQEGDLVYFQKKDSKLSNKWVIGKVDQVVRSDRDQKVRRVVVKYNNEKEEFCRLTDRSVRKLVKLFSIDEHQVQDDLAELQKKIDSLQGVHTDDDDVQQVDDEANEDRQAANDDEEPAAIDDEDGQAATDDEGPAATDDEEGHTAAGDGDDDPQPGEDRPDRNTRSSRCNCCCVDHCRLAVHTLGKVRQAYSNSRMDPYPCDLNIPSADVGLKVMLNFEDEEPESTEEFDDSDTLTKVLQSLNLEM